MDQPQKQNLDERTQKVLKDILAKEPSSLTQADKDFLRARQSYIGKNSRTKFADVFKEKIEKKVKKETPVEKIPDPLAHPADQEATDDEDDEGTPPQNIDTETDVEEDE